MDMTLKAAFVLSVLGLGMLCTPAVTPLTQMQQARVGGVAEHCPTEVNSNCLACVCFVATGGGISCDGNTSFKRCVAGGTTCTNGLGVDCGDGILWSLCETGTGCAGVASEVIGCTKQSCGPTPP